MKERLVIKNFGPIKNAELELGRFNILIGNQGTGKSTVAKVLITIKNTYFRDIFDLEEDESKSHETLLFLEHLKSVGIQNYLYSDTEIYFDCFDFTFEFHSKNVKLKAKQVSSEPAKYFQYDFTYIPSERNLVIALEDSLYALLETQAPLPKLFLRFGNKFQSARRAKENFDYERIIGINYFRRDNKDLIRLHSGKEILINDSSSGTQSLIPLLTVFDFVLKIKPAQDKLLVIEEPELNCFPDTQYKLINHFANTDYIKNQILITTHSPYILSSLNNLMYAYKIGQEHKEEANKIIEEKYWVDPNDVSAYRLLSDGTCEDILDRDESLIEADKIDEVSKIINKEFEDLMNIEFVNK